MLDILILGGTRLLGPPLVQKLSNARHRIAISSRTAQAQSLPPNVVARPGERSDPAHIASLFNEKTYDVVIDNLAYDGDVINNTIQPWTGRIGLYILTSTAWVYLVLPRRQDPFRENDLPSTASAVDIDPSRCGVPEMTRSYVRGKRLAEQAAAQLACPVQICRPCMFTGAGDHNGRIHWFVDRLSEGIFGCDDSVLPFQLAWVDDVAEAIVRMAEEVRPHLSCRNVAPAETVTIEKLFRWVAMGTGRPLPHDESGMPRCGDHPFLFTGDMYMNGRGIVTAHPGFRYTPAQEWVPRVAYDIQRAHPEVFCKPE